MTQRVLITAGGIGLAMAQAFLKNGAKVYISDINADAVRRRRHRARCRLPS
ncbi:hypothetical protein H0484_11030 [Pusillimonas sp. CC-YST705]|uniref:SDR family NAD(P)-dependent oxidoreductase n=1 Tax=Mesopusillimonas faecipullorum TaxID=2755040 RepID=A0ABS8CE09_9BURK|nr:hypothetical protein [Mesopusillimonas faecipullorum]MCB5364281.1 hypothetical protein [Mesopusillimonas faecipullorum]